MELFWSAFCCIRTELEEILCISWYSVRMRENANQNNSEYRHILRSEMCNYSPHYNAISKQNFLCCSVKLIKYHFSVVKSVLSKPSVRSLLFNVSSYYQYAPVNSYQHRILGRFSKTQYHQITKNDLVHQIQYHIQNK